MNKVIILVICMFLSTKISAEIKEIHQISHLETLTGKLKSADWLLFDIDYTLIEPSQPVLQMSIIKQNKQHFRDELAKFAEDQKELIPLLMVTQSPPQLIDPSTPNFIQKLQDRNIPILGFTALDTSVIPKIGSVPAWRAKELRRLGINFSYGSSFPKENIEFTEFPSFRGTFPLYENGILYSNVTPSKGAVLAAFLNKTSHRPSRIVFVDDSLENLQSVEAELKKQGIDFLGIHYKVQIDEIKQPKVSDETWDSVWSEIRARAKALVPLEGVLKTGNITAIQWASESMPEDSLIIFDVGNVLLQHKDAVLNSKYRPWIKEWFDLKAPEVDINAWRILSGVIDRQAEMKLVNPLIPSLINEAKKHATVIALSKFWCGASNENTSFEENKVVSLKNVGINFEEPFPNASNWHNKELEATYSSGLIQTEAPLKGPVLKAFLQHIGWQPKAILFIDDRKDQCDSILMTTQEMRIPTLCIHYTEAIDQPLPLDVKVADIQLRTLVNEKRWISDELVEDRWKPLNGMTLKK